MQINRENNIKRVLVDICLNKQYCLYNLYDYIKNLLSSNDLLHKFLLTLHLITIRNSCDTRAVVIQAKL